VPGLLRDMTSEGYGCQVPAFLCSCRRGQGEAQSCGDLMRCSVNGIDKHCRGSVGGNASSCFESSLMLEGFQSAGRLPGCYASKCGLREPPREGPACGGSCRHTLHILDPAGAWRECADPLQELPVEGYTGSIRCPIEWDTLCSLPPLEFVQKHASVFAAPDADAGVEASDDEQEEAAVEDVIRWMGSSTSDCRMPEWSNLWHVNSTRPPAGVEIAGVCVSLPVLGGGALVTLLTCCACTFRFRRKASRSPGGPTSYAAARHETPPPTAPMTAAGAGAGEAAGPTLAEQWRVRLQRLPQASAPMVPMVARLPGGGAPRDGPGGAQDDEALALALCFSVSEAGGAGSPPRPARVPDSDQRQLEAAIAASLAEAGAGEHATGAGQRYAEVGGGAPPLDGFDGFASATRKALEESRREEEARRRRAEEEERALLEAALQASQSIPHSS